MARQIRIDGGLAFVTLTQGCVAVIDAADVPLVEGFNWQAAKRHGIVYARRVTASPGRKTVQMHRALMGDPGDLYVDHIDGDGLNNRRSNLRVATHQQNLHNQRLSRANTSGLKGVVFNKRAGKWQAQIRFNGARKHLGMFATPEKAHTAYAKASAELHGEFGRIA